MIIPNTISFSKHNNKSIKSNLSVLLFIFADRKTLMHSNHITMNWICSLIVFQYTILLLHARPEASTTTTTTTAAPEKITLEMGHPSSFSAMITTSENRLPAEIAIPDIKKHLAADIAISPPLHSIKRGLSTPQVKKIEAIKKATNLPELVTFSTVTTNSDSMSKTTRYQDTKDILHETKLLTANKTIANNVNQMQWQNLTKSNLTLLNNSSVSKDIKQQHISHINRQYLSNAYNLNPYFSHLLTTPKTYQTVLAPASQSSYILLQQNELNSLGSIQPNGNILNIGSNSISPNYVNTESYQIARPPSALTVNIPYHEFPTQTPSPPILYNSANITKLYSVFVSSTPDPYTNYQAIQTKPPNRRKNVSTHRPYASYHKNSEHKYHNKNHNNHKYNQNNQNNKKKHEKPTSDFDNGLNNANKVLIVYNESDQFFSTNNTKNPFIFNNFDVNQQKNVTQNQTTNECIVSSNLNNPQTESVCKSNDLKIIIKLDGNSGTNATKKNEVKLKRKKITTTTTAPVVTANDNSLSYDSDEAEEESDEFGSYLKPFQNIFDFFPSSRDRRRRGPNKNKEKPSHGNKDGEVVNKYQTIILQTPPPPTPEKSELFKKSTLYKLLALIPIFGVLKPAVFGVWALALSPILVIAIGGVALGVVLYPFFAISRQQVLYASSQRSPKIVIHKHPRPTHTAKPYAQGVRVASWNSGERRRNFNHSNRHRRINNYVHPKRVIPIRLRKFQTRTNRRARDTQFQQWLLVQNNFNIRIMSPKY